MVRLSSAARTRGRRSGGGGRSGRIAAFKPPPTPLLRRTVAPGCALYLLTMRARGAVCGCAGHDAFRRGCGRVRRRHAVGIGSGDRQRHGVDQRLAPQGPRQDGVGIGQPFERLPVAGGVARNHEHAAGAGGADRVQQRRVVAADLGMGDEDGHVGADLRRVDLGRRGLRYLQSQRRELPRQHLTANRGAVDDQRSAIRVRRAQGMAIRLRLQAEHHREAEAGADILFGFDPDLAAHELGQLAADRQSQARPLERAVPFVLDLVEHAEHVLDLVGRDADPRVLYGDVDAVAGVVVVADGPDDADQNMTAQRELHRVADEVGQDLAHPPGVADELGGQEHVVVQQQVQRLLLHLRAHQHQNLVHAGFQIERIAAQLDPVGLDLGEVEDVVEDLQQGGPGVADRVDVEPLFIVQGRVRQQVCHADDAVHGRADLVAHVGEEGRFGAVGGLCPFALDHQGGLVLLDGGDIDPQADAPAVEGRAVHHAQPAAVGHLLFDLHVGVAVRDQAVLQPLFLAPDGVGVGAQLEAVAQDLLERHAGHEDLGAGGIDLLEPCVAHDHPVVEIVKDEAVRDRLDRLPHAHAVGLVDAQGHDSALGRAPVDEPDELAVPQPDDLRADLLFLPAAQHHVDPDARRPLGVDDALIGQQVQHVAVRKAGLDGFEPLERAQIGRVGDDQPVVAVEERKAVAHRLQRLPQAFLRLFGGARGLVQFGLQDEVLVPERFGLRDDPAHRLAVLQQGIGVLSGLAGQLGLDLAQFGLARLKLALGRETRAPLFRQLSGKIDVHGAGHPFWNRRRPSGRGPAPLV